MNDKVKFWVTGILLVICLMLISGFMGYTIANEESKDWQEIAGRYAYSSYYWKLRLAEWLWSDSHNGTYPYCSDGYEIQPLYFPGINNTIE